MDDPRASYWDSSYRKYWEDRVAEAEGSGESKVLSGDAKTEGDWVYEKIFEDAKFLPGRLLDVGCAWGRMFPLYHEHKQKISGIDISKSMIEAANEMHADHENVIDLKVATAENLPFEDDSFENLVCVAVFDATYQNEALSEFLRVVKPEGQLYLTGKNSTYPIDDEMAYAAEIGARSKGHPNYFTKLSAMLAACEISGCEILKQYRFEYRGNFAEFKHTKGEIDTFYEWCVVLKTPSVNNGTKFETFSSDKSETFLHRAKMDSKS